MTERLWTVEEANEALPRIAVLVEQARSAAKTARERAELVGPSIEGNGYAADSDAGFKLYRAAELLGAEGIVLRDPLAGLIDFPARSPSGRPYWLCWLAGEPEVAWWHWPDEGFAGRRRLLDPPD